jgi:transcription initiation factor IIF auxiliary subunit
MEKLAEALPQLQEEDLLQVVQMVHDNKTEDTYTKNDVESKSYLNSRASGSQPCLFTASSNLRANLSSLRILADSTATDGEFHVDLYTLPDPLIKMLWDFCDKKVDISNMA